MPKPSPGGQKSRTARLILFSLLIGVLVGCVSPATQAAVPPTPTLAPGWETHTHAGECGYAINHPSSMDASGQGTYSWIIHPTAGADGPAPNFIFISVIPDDFQNDGNEIIYNYDPAETQALLNIQVGESRSLRDDPNLADWFSYTRLPDAAFGNQTAQAYENDQPWEFPLGTKEIRYYLQWNGCTYLIGGYMATVGSGQPGAIDEDLFDQIIDSFHLPV